MNTEFEKEKVSADHSVYQPNRFRGGKPLKILLAVVCALMIGVASVAVFSDNNTSTHSIESITEIEKDGYTHKILSAYISNGRIYLDVFFYATDVGMKFSPPSLPDYEVYYQGKKCGGYTKVYGSAIGLSYKMPSVQKGEPMQVSLNAGEDFIADITLLPTNRPALNKERPYATVDDITLIADVQPLEQRLQVFISAILPQDADRGVSSGVMLINNYASVSGFAEAEVYIRDADGNIYSDSSIDSFDESVSMHRSYHIFFFDVPNDVSEFTIVIPKITYSSKNKDSSLIEKYGPWEIEVQRKAVESNSQSIRQPLIKTSFQFFPFSERLSNDTF